MSQGITGLRGFRKRAQAGRLEAAVVGDLHQHAGTEERRNGVSRIEPFEVAGESERRLRLGDRNPAAVHQKAGGGRAIVTQGHEAAPGVDQQDPREVAAGAREEPFAAGDLQAAAGGVVEVAVTPIRPRQRHGPGSPRSKRLHAPV